MQRLRRLWCISCICKEQAVCCCLRIDRMLWVRCRVSREPVLGAGGGSALTITYIRPSAYLYASHACCGRAVERSGSVIALDCVAPAHLPSWPLSCHLG